VNVPPVSTPKRYDGCNSFVFLEADPIILTLDSEHDLLCEANPMFGQLDEKSFLKDQLPKRFAVCVIALAPQSAETTKPRDIHF
jgi:hypothetical protein